MIHVVQRLPPGTRPPGTGTTDGASTSTAGAPRSRGNTPPGGANGTDAAANLVLGSFTLPTNLMDPNQVRTVYVRSVNPTFAIGCHFSIF